MPMAAISFLRIYLDYNVYGLLKFASSVLSLSVGLLILARNPRSKTHQWFFLITLTGALWLLGFALVHATHEEQHAYLWLRLYYLLSVPFISPCVYVFSGHWTNRPIGKRAHAVLFSTALAFGLIMFIFAPALCGFQQTPLGRLNLYRNGFSPRSYYYLITAFFSFLAVLSFTKLFKGWKAAKSANQKVQFRQFMIGFIVGYTGAIDFIVAGGLKIPNIGFISFTLFVLIIAYSIVRHKFMDVNLIVKKATLILVIYVILFSASLPIAIPVISRFLKQPGGASVSSILLISGIIGGILSMGPFIYAYFIRNNFWLKEKLTTGLAHELKSPIGAIQGATDVLFSQLSKDPLDKEKIGSYVEMIQRNNVRLETYVRNLLHVAKIQDENIAVKSASLDLGGIIRQLVESVEPNANAKRIPLKLEVDGNLVLYGEEEKLEQVFSNLLSNALKFSSQGCVTISAHRKNGVITCSVSDEGAGIAKKDLSRIFDRFYQGKNVNKGSGIGLTIAKAWVEAHGGKIWAESEGEGKGTRVTFTLPAGEPI